MSPIPVNPRNVKQITPELPPRRAGWPAGEEINGPQDNVLPVLIKFEAEYHKLIQYVGKHHPHTQCQSLHWWHPASYNYLGNNEKFGETLPAA